MLPSRVLLALTLVMSLLLLVPQAHAASINLTGAVVGTKKPAAQPGPLDDALKLIQAGKSADAEKLARKVIKESSDSAAAHEVLGVALALQDKVPQAIEALQQAIKLNAGQYTAWIKLGDIATAMGEPEKAISFYREALKSAPDDRLVNQRIGLYLAQHGALQPAIEHLKKGIAGMPETAAGLRVDLGRLYVRDGQPEQALKLLDYWDKAASDAKPVPPAALMVLGDAWLATGTATKAADRFKAVLATKGLAKDVPALVGQGRAYRALDRLDASIKTLTEAARLAPKDPAPQIELAASEALAGSGKAAQARLDQLVQPQRQPDTDTLGRAGQLYASMGLYEKARDVFARASEQTPNSPVLRANMTMVLLRLGDTRGALEQARKRLELAPGDADAAFMVGMLEEGSGDKAAAAKHYEQAIKNAPSHWQSLNNLALLRLNAGKKPEALSLARRAEKSAPDNTTVLDTLARVQEANGDANGAAGAWLKLGDLYLADQRKDEARKVLEFASRAVTDAALRAKIDTKLKAL